MSAVALVALGGATGTEAAAATQLTTPATHLKAGVMPKTGQRPLQTHSAPAGAHLTYYGGKVTPNVQVTQVLYGSGTYTSEVQNTQGAGGATIAQFYQGVTNSTYYDWLTEYNTAGRNGQDGQPGSNQTIGRGTFLTQTQISPSAANSGPTVDDTQIQAELSSQIAAHHLSTPTANTIYAVYFPANVTITQGGSSSGVQFCAYHGTVAASGNVPEFYYSVLPDFTTGGMTSGCGNGTRFQNETSVSSHELVETTTDAEVGIGNTVSRPLAWYDSTNGEIGDICNAQQATVAGGNGFTYTVQREFSNVQNNCVVSGPAATNDFSMSLSPTSGSVQRGGSTTSVVSTTATSGSGTVSLTASGQPSGVTVSFSPASVAAGGSSTMTVSTTTSTAAGTYPITVTGTEGSKTHTSGYNLTVTAPATNDFSITASPSSGSVAPGGSTTSTISTAVASGSSSTVSLTASGAPAGVNASLNPTSVMAGASSTLSLSTTSNAAPGTYTITVTGSEGSATHSTGFALTITGGSGGGGVTNGGFETGTLAGWSSSGMTAVVNSGAQAGAYAARVGSTSPSTDSSIAQTFTAPTGATGLSFYYSMTCPDSITYDWATATLKDNTAGTTSTPLPKTCATATWKQVTTGLTAGHSYTLTLANHDDNYASDPTYTLYDSVSITATVPPSGGVTNGGFETGTFSGWTPSGAYTAITTAPHSGSYAAQGGNTSQTNGDSNIVQAFTAPNGKSTLSAWYSTRCPDTLTYDWTTITLVDNTAGTTATLLPKTCAASSGWQQVSGAVTAGHSYTLTLTNHDDNYASDPTYTLFDDIALS